jgi:hypothetical protein
MSSIFQDGEDIYTDSTWESGGWRNYIRKPKAVRGTFPTDDVDVDFFCVEEDLVGYGVELWGVNANPDTIGRIDFKLPGGGYHRSSDGMILTAASINSPAYFDDPGYSWVAPGLGFRFAESVHEDNVFTAARNLTYTVSADDLSPKNFDGGVHSWIKLDVGGVGIVYAFYSKNIPGEMLQNRDSLLVFNSLGNKHSWADVGNVAFTMHLEGSLDGDNWETLAEIFDDVDINELAGGFSNAQQFSFLLAGSNYPKMNYYRFRWYSESGSGSERSANKQNFLLLSLYPTDR